MNLIPGETYYWWDEENKQVNVGAFVCFDPKSRICVLWTSQPYFVPVGNLCNTKEEADKSKPPWSPSRAEHELLNWISRCEGLCSYRAERLNTMQIHVSVQGLGWCTIGAPAETWAEAVQNALTEWDKREKT